MPCNITRLLPCWLLAWAGNTDRVGREFIVLKIKVIELSLPSSVSFKWTDNVNSVVKSHIFFSKFKVLCNFLSLSQESRFIELVSSTNSFYIDILPEIFLSLLFRLMTFWFWLLFRFRWLDIVIYLGLTDDTNCSSWWLLALILGIALTTWLQDGRILLASYSSTCLVTISFALVVSTGLINLGVLNLSGWTIGGLVVVFSGFGCRLLLSYLLSFLLAGIVLGLLLLNNSSTWSCSSKEHIIESFFGATFLSVGIEAYIKRGLPPY